MAAIDSVCRLHQKIDLANRGASMYEVYPNLIKGAHQVKNAPAQGEQERIQPRAKSAVNRTVWKGAIIGLQPSKRMF